ncbi:MAG: ATP-binding protein [Reyranella sp.]
MANNPPFTFEISLSVLNHLGRSLYRSFATVLGEAISNAWDADAKNVRIYIAPNKSNFIIVDDGIGMTADDFQNKFLRIGYSKRKKGGRQSPSGRPFIGRKGIGKLALLSCANRITVISKVKGAEYIGGIIDNTELDDAIVEDLKPQQYQLEVLNTKPFAKHLAGHTHGTMIHFEGIKDGIRSSFPLLEKIIALYFRFSLVDPSFKIFLNNKKITHEHLRDLAEKTQFLWEFGSRKDPYVDQLKKIFAKNPKDHETKKRRMGNAVGFVASVEKPRDLKITATGERVGVDLFVNGRLRERDIMKHAPTARVTESYLYGQIHFDVLDDKVDRFTSSREGIVADDPKYSKFLKMFKGTILKIIEEWDQWRIKHRGEGDPDNSRLSPKERASRGLYGAMSKEYELPKTSKSRGKVGGWVDDLSDDAAFNFESYADCFISENLIRRYMREKKIPLSPQAKGEAKKWKDVEIANKNKGNISIAIRRNANEASYLAMADLANLVDKKDPIKEACLSRDANEYKPIRDAVAHTALLTSPAKAKLSTVRENIKGRVKAIIAEKK